MCIYLEITEKENSALFLKKKGREMERKNKREERKIIFNKNRDNKWKKYQTQRKNKIVKINEMEKLEEIIGKKKW